MRSSKIVALVAFLVAAVAHPLAADEVRIKTLSTRPNTISGGDVLVAIEVPPSASAEGLAVKLNDRDVTGVFQLETEARTHTGLVTGLRPGANTLAVYTSGGATGKPAAQLTLTNRRISGPIFSGPHQSPLICETEKFAIPALGLESFGAAVDADCSIATRTNYTYRSTDGTFKPLPDHASRPADLARTTTSLGHTVRYIVHVESGTINRTIYQIAVLHDPSVESAPDPSMRSAKALFMTVWRPSTRSAEKSCGIRQG